MNMIFAALGAEILKLRRSILLLVTILIFTILPAMIALIATGAISTPAGGESVKDWNSYLGLVLQAYTGIGVLGMGFVASWLFGREYSDRTIKDLLALPIPRRTIVVAKFIVLAAWGCILSLLMFGVALALGFLMNLQGNTSEVLLQRVQDFGVLFSYVLMLSTPVAAMASISKGYLAPLGLVVAAVVGSQFASGLGIGAYFPWQIPTEFLASTANGAQPLQEISAYIVRFTGIGGALATIAWWRYADLSQ